jgi:hypothetical protein
VIGHDRQHDARERVRISQDTSVLTRRLMSNGGVDEGAIRRRRVMSGGELP